MKATFPLSIFWIGSVNAKRGNFFNFLYIVTHFSHNQTNIRILKMNASPNTALVCMKSCFAINKLQGN